MQDMHDYQEIKPSFQSLPVELVAAILSQLDLGSLQACAFVSPRLRSIASDPLLNPWRAPILRALLAPGQENSPGDAGLKNMSVLSSVPRHNWIEILVFATPEFLLFQATLPNLTEIQWQEAFRRRFLPSWTKILKDRRWREAFMRMLYNVWHRQTTACTTNEAWSNYMVLHRTGSANSCFTYSRMFDPLAVFRDLKVQANLAHLKTSVRVLLRLADVQIIVFGILHRPNSLFQNRNAQLLMSPPGVERPNNYPAIIPVLEAPKPEHRAESSTTQRPLTPRPLTPPPEVPRSPFVNITRALSRTRSRDSTGEAETSTSPARSFMRFFSPSGRRGSSAARDALMTNELPPAPPTPPEPQSQSSSSPQPQSQAARRQAPTINARPRPRVAVLRHPTPHPTQYEYPNYTSPEQGGEDWRWFNGGKTEDDFVEDDRVWVGPMLIAAQLCDSRSRKHETAASFEQHVLEYEQSKWASIGWSDLWGIAPWLEEKITKRIDGEGLGIE